MDGFVLAESVHVNAVGREEDVQDILAEFCLNSPQLSYTLHPPLIGTVRLKPNAESDGTSFLM